MKLIKAKRFLVLALTLVLLFVAASCNKKINTTLPPGTQTNTKGPDTTRVPGNTSTLNTNQEYNTTPGLVTTPETGEETVPSGNGDEVVNTSQNSITDFIKGTTTKNNSGGGAVTPGIFTTGRPKNTSGGASSGKTPTPKPTTPTPTPDMDIRYDANQAYLYGVGYVDLQMSNRVQIYQAVYIVKALGVRSVRVWADCMSDSRTLIGWRVTRLHELAAELKKANIQVIYNFNGIESPGSTGLSNSIPPRNTTVGSNYMKALDNFENMCKVMATEFPEIEYWEIGNEWNHNPFLHPIGWKEDGTGVASFTLNEKADISTDLMFRAGRGFKTAGNNSTRIMASLAPADGMDGITMTNFLERVYQNIESGNYGSSNPRDFFGALCWHPYIIDEPDLEWVENNHRIYDIAIKHGDEGIKVFLTEYGYNDGGSTRADATQAQWMVKGYNYVKKHMPYVESMHYYRLFTDTSQGEDLYGLMNQPEDGFGPKQKAEAFQEMAGGKGDLWKFFMPL